MKEFKIISDGSCDLPTEYVKQNNIDVVPFYITFDKVTYYKEGGDFSTFDILTKMDTEDDAFPSTSLPSPEDYVKVFTPYVEQGKDIICFCITTKFSGSYNSANTAKSLLLDQYPNAKILVIDTQINTVLQGLMVKEAVKMKNAGCSIDDIYNKMNEIKSTGRILFTLNTLKYLQHGGRIGKVSGVIGNLLNINPIITLRDGEIFSSGKALSRNRAVAKVKDLLKKHFTENDINQYSIIVGYGLNIDEAKKLQEQIAELLNISIDKVEIDSIGAVICAHTGPQSLGIAFIKKYDA